MRKLTEQDVKKAWKNGIAKATLQRRYYQYGWGIEKATTQPVTRHNKSYRLKAIENNIPKSTFYSRIRNGWTLEQASTIPTGIINRSNKIQKINTLQKIQKYDIKNKCPYDYNLIYDENICLDSGNCNKCWLSIKEGKQCI